MDELASGQAPQGIVKDEAAPPAPVASNGHKPASLDAIRAAKDVVESVDVPVPEWGVTVKVRGLTRGEMRRINPENENVDAEVVNARAMALAMLEPLVSFEEATEILDTKSFGSTARITTAIMEASGMGEGFRPG